MYHLSVSPRRYSGRNCEAPQRNSSMATENQFFATSPNLVLWIQIGILHLMGILSLLLLMLLLLLQLMLMLMLQLQI